MPRAMLPLPPLLTLCAVCALTGLGCATSAAQPQTAMDEDDQLDTPWSTLRARPTRLRVLGPSPEPAPLPTLPPDGDVVFERATYRSGDLLLAAVLARPLRGPLTLDTPQQKLPGVVLFHGGFHLADDQVLLAATVARAGFVVLMPMLRGENGNPGLFELMRGEVEDARAAARFLTSEPDVDVDHLYAFGHSAGGGLLTLLAIDGDVPFRVMASVNGVFAPSTFKRWQKQDASLVPFDVDDLRERQLRAVVPFAAQLTSPLLIYVGQDDVVSGQRARVLLQRARAAGRQVTVETVPGDHLTAVPEALQRFVARIVKDARPGAGPDAAPPLALLRAR